MRHERLISPASDGRGSRTTRASEWLLVLALLLGTPLAYVAWTNVGVTYTAEGNLWLSPSYDAEGRPIARALYPRVRAEEQRPGASRIQVDARGDRFTLVLEEASSVRCALAGPDGRRGSVGDCLDMTRTSGPVALDTDARVESSGLTPRKAARVVYGELRGPTRGTILAISLRGSDPGKTAAVLDSVMQELEALARRLEGAKLEATLTVLEQQLEIIGDSLTVAERDLDAFRTADGASPLEEARLERRVRSIETLHQNVRGRVEEARLARARVEPTVRILDGASVSGRPRLDVRLPAAVAVLLGGLATMAGGALVFGRSSALRTDVASRGIETAPDDAGALLVILAGTALAVLVTVLLYA